MKLPQQLEYFVSSVSSTKPGYPADNILRDEPENRESRWCSDSVSQPQYLMLRLCCPALVRRIQIGKSNSVPNTVKRLRVYGGINEENLVMVLDITLQDDELSETFTLRSQDGRSVPCKVIKIEPIESWNHSPVYSIYSISLFGYEEKETIFNAELHHYKNHKRAESLRLCMKLLRRENLHSAFTALASSVPEIQLEHHLLTQLYDALVKEGNFMKCESILQQLCDEGLLNKRCADNRYQIAWKLIHGVSDSEDADRPPKRGGHQMVFDPNLRRIYLFGGWSGDKDLADFWYFDLAFCNWHQISEDASKDGGPSPRSCHKMCIDSKRQQLYVIGKYPGPKLRRSSEPYYNEFYRYCLHTRQWQAISQNTVEDGGPPVIYDHQMAMDEEKNAIYIFGGRQLPFDPERRGLSIHCTEWPGLYRYSVTGKEWSLLKHDCNQLPSRMGHCMVLHPVTQELYIFGGYRNHEPLKTLCVYDLNTGKLQGLNDRNSMMKNSHNTLGYTQRVTIDPEKNEIYVYGIRNDHSSKPFWVYNIESMSWTCIYQNSSLSTKNDTEPMPRYAHQLVYDPSSKVHYLFGGNPATNEAHNSPSERLNDFWSFRLHRPSCNLPLRRCRYWLRRQLFRELLEVPEGARSSKPFSREREAVHLLQNELFSVIDHSSDKERQELHMLASWLVRGTNNFRDEMDWSSSRAWRVETIREQQRLLVWNQICSYVPLHLREPMKNVSDLVST